MLIPVLSVLITWAGGFWALAGNGPAEYGFPLPWKTVELVPHVLVVRNLRATTGASSSSTQLFTQPSDTESSCSTRGFVLVQL